MKNIFKNKIALLFFSLTICFFSCPSACAIDNNVRSDSDVNSKVNSKQDSEEENKKLQELEKVVLEWIEYSNKFPKDVEGQYKLYKKALELSKEVGTSI